LVESKRAFDLGDKTKMHGKGLRVEMENLSLQPSGPIRTDSCFSAMPNPSGLLPANVPLFIAIIIQQPRQMMSLRSMAASSAVTRSSSLGLCDGTSRARG